MVLLRRCQRDGHKTEPLQRLQVFNNELYKDDVDSNEDEVKVEFKASVEMKVIIDNGERIPILQLGRGSEG